MTKKTKKIIAAFLAAMMAFTAFPMSALAASSIGSDSGNISVGEDTDQNAKTTYEEVTEGNAKTRVYLTVSDSDLVVSVPTTIIVSGTPDQNGDYIGEYSVKVSGNMAGDKAVTVTPENEIINLHQTGKADHDATISQNQTVFNSDDFAANTTTEGKVVATGLSAGSWQSKTNFIIEKSNVNANIDYVTATTDMFSGVMLNSGKVMLTKYTGTAENVYVPSTLTYNGAEYPVMLNGDVFGSNTTIKNVLLGDQIYLFSMRARLFNGATNLETALFENNGFFANPEKVTGDVSEFSGCQHLKTIYDISKYTSATSFTESNTNLITAIPSSASTITINSDLLTSLPVSIPEAATKVLIVGKNLSGNITIKSTDVSSFELKSSSTSPYINSQTLTIKCPANSTTMRTVSEFVANGRHTISVQDLNGNQAAYNRIFALGDSLTAGGYYVPQLNGLVGDKNLVYNYGAEGDCTQNVARRIGESHVTITAATTIPADKTKVKIQLSDDYCVTKTKVQQDTAGVNCATINGVLGFITYENGSYYFQRANAGKTTHICAGTAIVTEFSGSYQKGETLVIYTGTNDFNSGNFTDKNSVDQYIAKIKAIVDYCGCSNYVVVGIAFRGNTPCSNETMKTYDNAMSNAFGDKYLNLREYFIQNAYKICPDVAKDNSATSDLANGIVPTVFFADGTTHWNRDTGGKIVAKAIYEKLNTLGYLK